MSESLVANSLKILRVRGESSSECSSCESWVQILRGVSGFSEVRGVEWIFQIHGISPHVILWCEDVDSGLLLEKVRRWLPWVPIMILSHEPTVEKAVSWMKRGASDYVSFPPRSSSASSLLQRIMKMRDTLNDPSFRDEMTGLFHQQYLRIYLQELIEESSQRGRVFGVLFLDLDQFKLINDSYGHHRGTDLLCEFSAQIKRSLRAADRVFRYGGDEFVVILDSLEASAVHFIAERLKFSLENHFYLQGQGLKIQIRVSLGVSLFPEHGGSYAELIEAADQAMYREKRGLGMSKIIPVSDQRDQSWNRKSRADRNINLL